jgi:hypothetical protein
MPRQRTHLGCCRDVAAGDGNEQGQPEAYSAALIGRARQLCFVSVSRAAELSFLAERMAD